MSTDYAFPPQSRYYGLPITERTLPDGRKVAYVRRRFVPPPENFAPVMEHRVLDGQRLDNIAAHYLGDPEQFWRLCDANNALDPEELTEHTGGKIIITLPEGIPAPTHA